MAYKTAKVYSGTEWIDLAVSVSDPGQRALTTVSTTTYTPNIVDAGRAIIFTNGSAVTLTIPLESSVAYSLGQTLLLIQKGAGQVTVAGAVGVTIRSLGSKTKISGQYGEARLIKIASDEWLLSGDLTT